MLALVDADVGTADLIVERIRARVASPFSAGIVSLPPPRHRCRTSCCTSPRARCTGPSRTARRARSSTRTRSTSRCRPRRPPSATCAPGSSTPSTRSPARSTPRTATRTRTPSASPATPPSSAARSGCAEERLELLRTAGVLHDVGKIGIPDAVLLKPAKLDADEFAVMRRHSELGRDIIAGAGLEEIATWVLHLHERFDGRGYPDGLAADDDPAREPHPALRRRARGDDLLAHLPAGHGGRACARRARARRGLPVRSAGRRRRWSTSCVEGDLLTDRTIAQSRRA